LCGGNVLVLAKVLRLVVWIRLDWRTGISRKDVTDEIVVIHSTRTVRGSSDHSGEKDKKVGEEIEEEKKREEGHEHSNPTRISQLPRPR
jgi:hypothetical protein